MTRWTEADVARHQAKLGRLALDGEPAKAKPRKHKYKAEACLVTADLTLFAKKDIQQLAGTDVEMPLRRLAMLANITGQEFPSRHEAHRYIELKKLESADMISQLELQVPYLLTVQPQGKPMAILGEYRLDFRYFRCGRMVHEDAKGVRTELYAWKKKHVEAQYGIEIIET